MTEPTTTAKKRCVIHLQAREMAKKVLETCVEERNNKYLILPLNDAFGRASLYTGLSKSTLAVIRREAKEGRVRSPSKKGRTCNKMNNVNVDDIDRSVIHRIIEEFYLTKNDVPTCTKLLAAIREKIVFPWKQTSVRRLLKEMGYRWQNSQTRRRVLVEKPDIFFARSIYLEEIRKYRQEGRKIIFVGETWFDKNLNFKKSWRNETHAVSADAVNRIILVHAGSKDGFINNAKLLYQYSNSAGEYHGQLNAANFEKWVTEMLIPNLPERSVVVMDNAPYHNEEVNKPPTKFCPKSLMLEWLTSNGVAVLPNMRKSELFELIEMSRPKEKMYKIDQLLHSYGHDVVRLPPFMSDLNPIELAWENIKTIVKDRSIHTDLCLQRLKILTDEAIGMISQEDWNNFDSKVVSLEEEYWKRDSLIEDVIDGMGIKPKEEQESDEDSDVPMESDDE